MLFAFPAQANEDVTKGRQLSTFKRASQLFATVSGRGDYTDPGEKFENVTMMLFQPYAEKGKKAWVKLFDAQSGREIPEDEYYEIWKRIYNERNPHALIGPNGLTDDEVENEE
jgi:hypothetical protein